MAGNKASALWARLIGLAFSLNIPLLWSGAYAYIGCYDSDLVRPRVFSVSPGTYDPTVLTATFCRNRCAAWGLYYAALGDGAFCMCNDLPPTPAMGPDLGAGACSTTCPADGSACGGPNNLVSVYNAPPPIRGLSITPRVTTAVAAFTAVTFDTVLDVVAPTYLFSYDYGDGTTEPNTLLQTVTHSFSLPGDFVIRVTVDDSSLVVPSAWDATSVLVQAPVRHVILQCPPFIMSTLEFNCNVTVSEGSYMILSIDYDDGNFETITIADAAEHAAGAMIPVAAVPGVPSTLNRVFLMREAQFLQEGRLVAFEYYAETLGDIEFLVFTVSCTANTYCVLTNDCPAACADSFTDNTCTAPMVFTPGSVADCCTNGLAPTTCPDPTVGRFPPGVPAGMQYTVAAVIPHTITTLGRQFFYVNLTAFDVWVNPGDIIGYQSAAGQIQTRAAGADAPDWMHNGGGAAYPIVAGTVVANGDLGNFGTERHLLRAIASHESVVQLYHTFAEGGIYNANVTVRNEHLNVVGEWYNLTLIVQDAINYTIIINPEFWALSKPVEFEILPHTGNPVTYFWNWNDGSGLENTTNRFINHTFNAVGLYNVTALSQNILMGLANWTEIEIQQEVFGLDMYSEPGLTNVPHPVLFNITRGTHYTCDLDWRDGTVSTYNVTNVPLGVTTLYHTWGRGGVYLVRAHCYNNVSFEILDYEVLIGGGIVNLHLIREGALQGIPFHLEYALDEGVNCTFNLTFDGVRLDYLYNETELEGMSANAMVRNTLQVVPLSLYAVNLVDSELLLINFTIEQEILNVVITPEFTSILRTHDAIDFNVTMDQGTSVRISSQYFDGVNDSFAMPVLMGWELRTDPVEMFRHPFHIPGVYDVLFQVSNAYSTVVENRLVKVYNEVDNLTLHTNSPVAFLESGELLFWFTTSWYPPTEASIVCDFDDGYISRPLPFELLRQYPHPYSAKGIYTLNCNVSNLISWKNYSAVVILEVPVANLQLHVDPPHVALNYPVWVNVSMSIGDNVTITWKFSDGPASEFEKPRLGTTPYDKDPQDWTYTALGIYVIEVTTENILGNTTILYTIHVQDPVWDCFTLVTTPQQSPYIPPTDTVVVTIDLIFNPAFPFPTNPSMLWLYGDYDGTGPVPQVEPVPTTLAFPPYTLTRTHTYTEPGNYVTNVTLFNLATREELLEPSGVFVAITGLTVDALYTPVIPLESPPTPGFGPLQDIFPSNLPVQYFTDTTTGTIVEYEAECTDVLNVANVINQTCDTCDAFIEVAIAQPATYYVSVTARNPLSFDVGGVQVEMREVPEGLVLNDSRIVTTAGEAKTIDLTFVTIGLNTALQVDSGITPTTYDYYGPLADVTNVFGGGLTTSGPITDPMSFTYTYTEPGSYTMTVVARNEIHQETVTLTFTVAAPDEDCATAVVNVFGGAVFPDAIEFERSRYLDLLGVTQLSCTDTLANNKMWEIFRVNQRNGSIEFPVDITANPTSTTSHLVLPSHFLDFGYYHVVFTVTMDPFDTFLSSAETSIKIIRSRMVAIMIEGGMSSVKRTWGRDVVLPAKNYSRDPDLDPSQDQGLSFTWFCRRLDENYPVYPNGSLIEVNPVFPYPVNVLNSTTPPLDYGGCFRQGPGAVDDGDAEPGLLHFNTMNMQLNETYEIMLVIRKDERESRTTLTMLVVEDEMPDVIINVPISIGVPIQGGMLINPNNRIALTSCVESCRSSYEPSDTGPTAASYSVEWVIEREGLNGAFVRIEDVAPYVSEIDSQSIAISSQLLSDDQERYQRPINYRVTMLIDGVVGSTGESSTVLFVNPRPSGGTCSIDPLTGQVGQIYTVLCTGWTDDEGIKDYNIFVRHPEHGLQQITYEEDARGFLVQFPAGLPSENYLWEVSVRIVDRYGGDIYYLVGNITVNEVPRAVYEADMDTWLGASDVLATIMAERNEGEMMNTFPGIANMIDSRSEQLMQDAAVAMQASVVAGDATVPPEYVPQLTDALNDPNDITLEEFLTILAVMESNGSSVATRYMQRFDLVRAEAAQVMSNMSQAVESIIVSVPPDVNSVRNVGVMLQYVISDPAVTTRAMQIAGASAVESLSEILNNIEIETPLEEVISAATPLLKVITTIFESVQNNMNNPTQADLWDAMQSELYFFDADWETYRADIGYSLEEDALQIDTNNILQINTARQITPSCLKAMDLIQRTLSTALVGGEDPARIVTSSLEVSVMKETRLELLNSTISTMYNALYDLPAEIFDSYIDVNGNEQYYDDNDIFTLSLTAMGSNSLIFDDRLPYINLPLLDISLRDPNNVPIPVRELQEPLSIGFFHNLTYPFPIEIAPFLPSQTTDKPKRFGFYHSLELNFPYHAIVVGVSPKVPDTTGMMYLLCMGMNRFPNWTVEAGWDCDAGGVVPNYAIDDPWSMVYSNMDLNNTMGKVTVLVRELPAAEQAVYITDNTTLPEPTTVQEDIFDTINYDLYTCNASCSYYNERMRSIEFDGGWVDRIRTNLTYLFCYWNHTTIFGGGFAVHPNTIDWQFVFANADFYRNITLYVTEIVITIVYILTMIWARREDKRDLMKLGVSPLPDNLPNDRYLYEVVVYTGMARKAGTESKVSIIISGDDDETDVRRLSDPKRKIMKRGGVDAFLLTTSRSLGALNFIRIWHDNSGRGKHASWYLKYIVVTDLQTQNHYYFLADKWLAVEEDDGSIDRLLPLASRDQMVQFGYLFTQSTRKKIGDEHLWFSVVTRPPQSRFTRVQRVSCCLLLLFTSMFANALFYERAEETADSSTVFTMGPFALTPEQLFVGVVVNLIVFPINFLVVWLFRKSRKRVKRQSRVKKAISKQAKRHRKRGSTTDTKSLFSKRHEDEEAGIQPLEEDSESEDDDDGELEIPKGYITKKQDQDKDKDDRPATPRHISIEEKDSGHGTDGKKKKKKKKPLSLPWWCNIIGWIILWLSVLACACMVTFYGIMFGDIKCKKWISSLIISFLTSIFCTQPIKVVLVAAIISIIFKDPHVDEDEAIAEDEEALDIAPDEEYLHEDELQSFHAARPRKHGYERPSEEMLERHRTERVKTLKMYDIFREITFYALFLWILMVVSYGFRDPKAYLMRNGLRNILVDQGLRDMDTFYDDFLKIGKIEAFWDWATNTLIPGTRAWQWYNGDWLPGQRGFFEDRVSRVMGFATVRQLRIPKGTCSVQEIMSPLIADCHKDYDIWNEETGSYGPHWVPLDPENNITAPYEFQYRTAEELEGYPYWATHGLYGGGGYVFELRGSLPDMLEKVAEVRSKGWLDRFTRAVFVELTVYNAQINLFAIITMVVEMTSTGGSFPAWRVEPVNLLVYDSDGALFTIICQILFLLFVVAFIVKEIRNLRKQGIKYFLSFWSWVELGIIVLSIVGVVIFFYRYSLTSVKTDLFRESGGNAYMKFQYIGYWHELLLYMLGWLVFLATIKFLKLLRFNRRMSLLASTLKDAATALGWFSIMFGVVFFAYTQLFYMIYLTDLVNFSSFLVATETCMQMMLGRFDFYEMQMASPWLGPMFFFSYVVAVAYILINMFLTIINDSFASVREDLTKQMNDHEMVEWIIRRFKVWTGFGKVSAEDVDAWKNVMLPGQTKETEGTDAPSTANEKCIAEFPDKIDRLIAYVSKVYAMNTDYLENIALEKMEKKAKKSQISD